MCHRAGEGGFRVRTNARELEVSLRFDLARGGAHVEQHNAISLQLSRRPHFAYPVWRRWNRNLVVSARSPSIEAIVGDVRRVYFFGLDAEVDVHRRRDDEPALGAAIRGVAVQAKWQAWCGRERRSGASPRACLYLHPS